MESQQETAAAAKEKKKKVPLHGVFRSGEHDGCKSEVKHNLFKKTKTYRLFLSDR